MKREIERKFLVRRLKRRLANGVIIDQGYLCFEPEVRVRVMGNQGFVGIKSRGLLSRDEFEYRIPRPDARRLLSLCPWRIRKQRHHLGAFCIDVYKGKLRGLMVAEVELKRRNQPVKLPRGLESVEVTFDRRYRNRNLVKMTRRAFLQLIRRTTIAGGV